jgi:hypothetical protein
MQRLSVDEPPWHKLMGQPIQRRFNHYGLPQL